MSVWLLATGSEPDWEGSCIGSPGCNFLAFSVRFLYVLPGPPPRPVTFEHLPAVDDLLGLMVSRREHTSIRVFSMCAMHQIGMVCLDRSQTGGSRPCLWDSTTRGALRARRCRRRRLGPPGTRSSTPVGLTISSTFAQSQAANTSSSEASQMC